MRFLARLLTVAPLVAPQSVFALDPGRVPPITLGTGSSGDASAVNVTPSPLAPSGTLARSLADQAAAIAAKAPLASPTFTGAATVPTLALSGTGSTGDVSGMSVAGRPFSSRVQDTINVRDQPYGALCDGSTDDTAAFARAFTAAASSVKAVYVPAGTCMVSGLTYPSLPYAQQFSLYGDGQNLSRIKLLAGSVKPALTIGAAAATNFTANIAFRGLTFDANGQNQPAVVSYDLVRTRLQDILFTGGSVGYLSYGGIGNIIDADARGNSVGVRFTKFASQAGGGWPNLIRWSGAIASNTTLGVDIDYARSIKCVDCDIEGNGSTYNIVGQGGVMIGSNMGSELASVGPTLGFECRSCWFEANKGHADILSASGLTVVEASAFASAPSETLYDMHFNGGVYTVTGTTGAFNKTTVKDEGTVQSGVISGGFLPRIDAVKAVQVQTALATNLAATLTAGGGAQITGGKFRTVVHTETGGAAPTISSCGTSPAVAGTDSAGTLTIGSGGPSGCTILFALAYPNPPICTVTSRSGVPITYATQTDRLVVSTSNSSTFSGSSLDYTCIGR